MDQIQSLRFLLVSGVGNSKIGVGRIPGEWSPRYGVEIWSGSGNRGVGVGDTEWWCGSGRFYNATPITHMPPLHCTPPPNPPLHPYPINPQSIKFSSQQSQGLRVNFCISCVEWQNWSGHNYFAIFWSGANLQKSPSTVLHALRTSDLPLSYSATTFGVGRIKPLLIRPPGVELIIPPRGLSAGLC